MINCESCGYDHDCTTCPVCAGLAMIDLPYRQNIFTPEQMEAIQRAAETPMFSDFGVIPERT